MLKFFWTPYNFTAALILYLFNIDLVLIPPHTSHILQAFDVREYYRPARRSDKLMF